MSNKATFWLWVACSAVLTFVFWQLETGLTLGVTVALACVLGFVIAGALAHTVGGGKKKPAA